MQTRPHSNGKMTRKKSANGSEAAGRAAQRVPMREFSRSLPMSLLRAREAVMRQFRPSLRRHDLTEQQWRILRALAAIDAIEVTELARTAFLLGPSLSRILRDLEARRLIERKTAKTDLRRGVVSISEKGVKLMEVVRPRRRRSTPRSPGATARRNSASCRTCWARWRRASRISAPRPRPMSEKRKFA